MRLNGKVAIVAGAGWGGIGGTTAHRFVQEGVKEGVNVLPGEGRLQETVGQICALGGGAGGGAGHVQEASVGGAVAGNVKEVSMWQALVAAALKNFGQLNILMNNAANATIKPAIEITEAEWNEALAVTLTGSWLGAKYCIPEMIKAGGGSIVFTS